MHAPGERAGTMTDDHDADTSDDADTSENHGSAPATEVTNLDDLDTTPHAEVFEGGEPRTVRLHLAAGEGVPAHRHPDATVVLYVVSGELELALDGDVYDIGEGDAVRFDGELAVSPTAVEGSVALVVLAPDGEDR